MLSVVVPTYRKPLLLRRTLEALVVAGERLGERWEVVVVDDGSGDETGRVLEEMRPRLPLVEAGSGENVGRARARNRGWRAAQGRWVLFLDDDILLEADALRAHRGAQAREEGVYLGAVRTDPAIVDSPLFDYLDSRGIAKHPPGAAVPARYLLTQNVSLPRSALEHIGGFDEDFGAYGFEDMELAFRLEDALGLRFFHLDGAAGLHIHHHGLDDYLEKKRVCGRTTLPRLAALHPRRLREMRLDLLRGLGGRSIGARLLDLSFRMGTPRLLRGLLRSGARGLPRALRRRVYDYLVLAAYAEGLQERDAASLTD